MNFGRPQLLTTPQVTQDLHPGGEHYPNEPPVDSDNNQGVSDPVFHYNLEAADVNSPTHIDYTLS